MQKERIWENLTNTTAYQNDMYVMTQPIFMFSILYSMQTFVNLDYLCIKTYRVIFIYGP